MAGKCSIEATSANTPKISYTTSSALRFLRIFGRKLAPGSDTVSAPYILYEEINAVGLSLALVTGADSNEMPDKDSTKINWV